MTAATPKRPTTIIATARKTKTKTHSKKKKSTKPKPARSRSEKLTPRSKQKAPNVHRFISLPLSRRCISLTRNATDRMLSLDNPDTRLPSTATDSFALVHSDDDRRWLYGDVSRFPENTRLPINSLFVLFFPFILQQKHERQGQYLCVRMQERQQRRSCSNTAKLELSFVVVCSMRTRFRSKRVEPDGRSDPVQVHGK